VIFPVSFTKRVLFPGLCRLGKILDPTAKGPLSMPDVPQKSKAHVSVMSLLEQEILT
jgi:hypothetical protein